MKFTNHIIVITSNYDCYMLYGKRYRAKKTEDWIYIIQLESYVDQIIKGYGYERDNKYIEQNVGDGDLNAAILCCSTFYSSFTI